MRLHINIDHVATVRQARRTDEPDPVRAAVLAELGGADGITVHLRADRRHIQDRDVSLVLATARTPVNLELGADPEMLTTALELGRPHELTIVPETRQEITTEGGLALGDPERRRRVEKMLGVIRAAGIISSLFIDPDEDSIRIAADMGSDAIELHTGAFAEAWKTRSREAIAEQVGRLRRGAALAASLGLGVHAGHGLTYENVAAVARLPEIDELNIGHSVVSRAVLTGMESAVREMRRCITEART